MKQGPSVVVQYHSRLSTLYCVREREESKIAMDNVCDMHTYSYCKGIVWNLEIPCCCRFLFGLLLFFFDRNHDEGD